MTPISKSTKIAAPPTVAVVVSLHLRGIDGLRALAVILVVLFHVLPGTLPQLPQAGSPQGLLKPAPSYAWQMS